MKFIGFYDYTVILTYISLISGIIGMYSASRGKFFIAIVCLAVSGICDMFDGAVARSKKNRTEDEKSFGIQLDSLCDVICFGVFPAVFLYFRGMYKAFGLAILIFYVLCALIRLAFFNVLETKRQKSECGCAKYYRGLPVTTVSMTLPFLYLLDSLFLPNKVAIIMYFATTLLTALLFITDVRIPKLDVSKFIKKLSKAQEAEESETEDKVTAKVE